MGFQSQILRFRKRRRAKDRSNPLGLIGFLLAAVVSLLLSGGVIYGINRYANITRDLPSPTELEFLLDPLTGALLEPTLILDRSGKHVLWRFENPTIETRRYTPITAGDSILSNQVPDHLIWATLAAVDPDYFQRPERFLAGVLAGGEDPIPETVVKDLLLWDELDHAEYPVRLGLLADQIIATYGREQVLEWYLNSVVYGNQIYGVAQAAAYYFGKAVSDLTLAESAMLAAVANFPALNPLDAPVAAGENQAQVLQRMAEEGFISSSEAEQAARSRLIFADVGTDGDLVLPAFVSFVLDQAGKSIPQERLLRGGYRIISTLDHDLQETLSCTVEVMNQRVYGEDLQLETACQAARLLPRYVGPFLDSSTELVLNVVVYDPLSGELTGMMGYSGTEGVPDLDKPRDPGSLITPYIYLNAFTQGFGPASLVWDLPPVEEDVTAADLHPGTGLGAEYLGPISIRTALINDLLSPSRQLLEAQGLPQLRSTLGVFGHSLSTAPDEEVPAGLVNMPLSMLDLVQGYGVFVNRGYLKGLVSAASGAAVQPSGILRIEDTGGRESVLPGAVQEKKVISEELVYLINQVLSDQDAWLDPRIADVFRIGRPAAVKTGYVADNRSGWVIGYTPEIVVGVWTGGLDPQLEGSDLAPVEISAAIWRAVTQHVSRGSEVQEWELPPGIITEDVCYPSGDLPTAYCPRIVREIFIRGNEPLGPDTLYQAFEVNRETGLLASVFTPTSQIEERVYLTIPPFAASWAAEAGIESPPEVYDLVGVEQDEEVFGFSEPDNLSFVRGRVRIVGSIPEEEFVSARLQYGVGLNPRSWLQIGEEITDPAVEQFLGFWDTTELAEGIYALQLVVIQEEQQIQKRALILSVDNTPPEMILMTDFSGGVVPYQRGEDLLLEVKFTNPSEIEQVDFVLDDRLLASRRVDPFIVPWQLTLGTHELVIQARDQAGNETTIRVVFQVKR